MKNARIIVFFFLSLSLTSCATSNLRTTAPPQYWGIVPLGFKEVVSEPEAYSTEKGRKLMIRYERNLENIFARVRDVYKPSEIEFFHSMGSRGAGLSFMKLDKSDDRYLALTVIAPFTFFQKGQSTYQERAAILFATYIKSLIGIALEERKSSTILKSQVSGY
jgi:hypothetical protein